MVHKKRIFLLRIKANKRTDPALMMPDWKPGYYLKEVPSCYTEWTFEPSPRITDATIYSDKEVALGAWLDYPDIEVEIVEFKEL